MTVDEWKGKATVPIDLLWWLSCSVLWPNDIVAGIHNDFLLMIRPIYRNELVMQPDGCYKSVPVQCLRNEYYFVCSDDTLHRVLIDCDQFNSYLNLSSVECLI